MLLPNDFSREAIFHPLTRMLMDKMTFKHGGDDYDSKYPEGIPTSVQITDRNGMVHDSGLIMFPAGHARNTTADLHAILDHKFNQLATLATDDPKPLVERYSNIAKKSAGDIRDLNNWNLKVAGTFD